MIAEHIIPETLESFDYYVNKLPLYLRQSDGFIEHYRIWYDLLVGEIGPKFRNSGVIGSAHALFNLMNIFDQEVDSAGNITNTYLQNLIQFEDADVDEQNKYGKKSDILDKLGALFGVTRQFEVTYKVDGEDVTKYLNLNNEEFLLLIKVQIVKNNFDGSYSQIKKYYEDVGLYVYVVTAREPATCYVYLGNFQDPDSRYHVSENVNAMFLAGLLTIRSMGIKYIETTINLDNILVWDVNVWDEGEWVI